MAKAKAKPTIANEQPMTVEQCADVIWGALQFTSYRPDIGDDKKPDAHAIELKKRELLDVQNHFEDRMTLLRANTAQDARIQLAYIQGIVELNGHSTLNEEEERRESRKLSRLIFSVARWIEAEHGVRPHSVCNYYMDEAADPWNAVTN